MTLHSLVLSSSSNQSANWLKRTSFNAGDGTKDEDWLQDVLFMHSDLIPIAEIDRAASGFVPICRELTIPKSGPAVFLDIFGVTPEGKLVLIECKLWRNPQARREVIAQTLEYAALISQWSYGDLTARINAKQKSSEANPIYRLVAERFPEVEEARFVDRVTQSLKTGDFVLIIAGDGIRPDVHAIADYLNQSSGTNAHLALVEFQLWEDDAGNMTIIPSIPLRTELIQQRVIIGEDGVPLSYVSQEASEGNTDPIIDPDREAAKAAEKAFWQAFIDEIVFDHPDQTKPRHGGHGWVRMLLPDPVGWMTAYRTKDGNGGLFIRCKGDDGELVCAEFEDAKPQLETALEFTFELETKKTDPFEAMLSIPFDGNAKDDLAFGTWLNTITPKVVSTFRPFISQFG